MSETETVSRGDMMRQTWAEATRCRPALSPLMQAAREAMIAAADSRDITGIGLRDVADRIGRHTGEWVDSPVFLGRYEGEWHVSNADIEMWARVRGHGGRLFPAWRLISGEIDESLRGKRRWQAYERFRDKGLTDEHRRLAARLNWDFSLSRDDWVSLYVQGKRPFGNSDIEGDIADAVGWPQPWREDDDWDGDRPDNFTERAWDLFEELQFAVPTILRELAAPAAPPATPAPR